MRLFSEDYDSAKSNFEKEKERITTAAIKEIRGLLEGEENEINLNVTINAERKIKAISILPSATIHYFKENSDIKNEINFF